MHPLRRRLIAFLGTVCVAGLVLSVFFFYIPRDQDAKRNTVSTQPSGISQPALTFHNSLFIADLHADSLLWSRNLKNRHAYGHLDVPRMLEGNISLQVFSVVTKTPRYLNLYANDDRTDNITLLAIAQRWPANTWASLYERAVFQSQKLHTLQQASHTPFYVIQYREDLAAYLENRRTKKDISAGLLSLEGAHALEGKLDNVNRLFDAGFRIIGFTHFFDNRLGGSAHGLKKGGITEFGIEVLKRMESLGMLVDLSHASPSLISDIFKYATKPVIATHTGVRAVCGNSPRNLTDAQVKLIAESGGIIGIGFWPHAVCTDDVQGIVDSIQYVIDLVGENHVALGSDFDGNVQTPFDGAHLYILTQALWDANLTRTQIEKIMGANVVRLLLEYLPAKSQLK